MMAKTGQVPMSIHIGTPKTGTTSIQEFLYTNRELLLREGYIYCSNLGETNNVDLALAALHPDELDWDAGKLEKLGYNGLSGRQEFFDIVVSKLSANVDRYIGLPANKRSILASSELFWMLNSEYHFESLKKLLNLCSIDLVNIYVYIRSQPSYLLSSLSTMVRDGWITPSLETEWLKSNRFRHLNYHERLMIWRQNFPAANIHVQLFEECKKDLVGSFLRLLKLESINAPKNIIMNEGLSSLGLEVMARINLILANRIDVDHDANMRLAKFIEKPNSLARDILIGYCNQAFKGRPCVDLAKLDTIEKFFESSNQSFVREFLNPDEASALILPRTQIAETLGTEHAKQIAETATGIAKFIVSGLVPGYSFPAE
jgi:hypothetical protein